MYRQIKKLVINFIVASIIFATTDVASDFFDVPRLVTDIIAT